MEAAVANRGSPLTRMTKRLSQARGTARVVVQCAVVQISNTPQFRIFLKVTVRIRGDPETSSG